MNESNTATASQKVMDRVRSTASSQLSNQKERATDGLGNLAHAVRQSAQPLRDSHQDTIAQYVDKAADEIERLSSQLREKDLSELVDDAQRFARRQPAVFIGSAFAVGLFAARFLKSSNDRQDGSWRERGMPAASSSFRAPAPRLAGTRADEGTLTTHGAV